MSLHDLAFAYMRPVARIASPVIRGSLLCKNDIYNDRSLYSIVSFNFLDYSRTLVGDVVRSIVRKDIYIYKVWPLI